MKIAISGKGGVGKTTVCALLAETYAHAGRSVLAVDTDPSPTLAQALAIPESLTSTLQPIAEMGDLIEERTGAKPGASGSFFTLNPRVDDLPDRFSVLHRGIRLLEMGRVESGGAGCICPESALLRALFTQLLFRSDEVLLLDMYAGVEHLGRATVDFVDAMVIVVEPTHRSLAVGAQIEALGRDIGLDRFWWIGNRIRNQDDVGFLEEAVGPLLGSLPNDVGAIEADRAGLSVFDGAPLLRAATVEIAEALDRVAGTLQPGDTRAAEDRTEVGR
jgi:CO dehydrogenase maturation factor